MVRPQNAAATKFDFSTNASFGFKCSMFLAEFGSSTPLTGETDNLNGYTVLRIDPETKEVQPFLTNIKTGLVGKEYVSTAGPRYPVEAKFSRDGEALYIVDIGVIGFQLSGAGPFPTPYPGTGVIWRITREGNNRSNPPANLSPMPPPAKF